MSIDDYRKRKNTYKQPIKTKRALSVHARRLLRIRSSSHSQRIKGVSFPNNGSIVYITRGNVPKGRIVGHISKNGRIYNIVVTPQNQTLLLIMMRLKKRKRRKVKVRHKHEYRRID